MYEPRRLHPAAALIRGIQMIRHSIVPLLAGTAPLIGRHSVSGWLFWLVTGGAILLCLVAVWGFLSWRRFTYRVEDGELRMEYGVLIRSRRFIPHERIQSIDLVESVLHRLFGVVNVQVKTAGGDDPEGLLTAVSRADAEALRQALIGEEPDAVGVKADIGSAEEDTPVCERRITYSELLFAGVTSGSIGIVLSLVGGALSFVDTILPDLDVFGVIDRFFGAGTTVKMIAFVAIMALVIAWIGAIAGTVIKYFHFRVTRSGDDIIIERGLFARRRSTIPLARVQAVRIVEGVLRQPFGFVSLHVESAGFAGIEEGFTPVLFPLMKRGEAAAFLHEMIPEFAQTASDLERLPRRARRRFVIRILVPAAAVSVIASFAVFPWGLGSLVLLPFALAYGLLRYYDAGWQVHGGTLVLRFRGVGRTTAIVTRRRVQSCRVRQSFFQRRKQLVSFQVSVASGSRFGIVDADERAAACLYDWVSTRLRKRRLTGGDGSPHAE